MKLNSEIDKNNSADQGEVADQQNMEEKNSINNSAKGLYENQEDDKFKPPRGVVFLTIINIFILSATAFFITSLPKKAKEVKEQRNALASSITLNDIQNAEKELELYKEKTDKIKNAFPDDSGLIDFVKYIEEIKMQGVLKKFSFANKDAIKDATGYYGIPIVIELSGSWDKINSDVERFEKLPYLIKPVKVEAKTSLDEKGQSVIDFKYGIFLYVNESFGKDR